MTTGGVSVTIKLKGEERNGNQKDQCVLGVLPFFGHFAFSPFNLIVTDKTLHVLHSLFIGVDSEDIFSVRRETTMSCPVISLIYQVGREG